MIRRSIVLMLALSAPGAQTIAAGQARVAGNMAGASQKPAADAPLLSTVPSVSGGMPAPQQMAGLPLQVGDLPPGTVAVRLVRGGFDNKVTGTAVELHAAGGKILNSTTNDDGRAMFSGLAVGEEVRAVSVVDGEKLESKTFALPPRGGVRVMLVAGVGVGTPVPVATSGRTLAAASVSNNVWGGWSGSRVALVSLLLGGAGVMAFVGTRKRSRAAAVRDIPAAPTARDTGQRDALFARLIELEDGWEAGEISPRQYREEREPLIKHLEELE